MLPAPQSETAIAGEQVEFPITVLDSAGSAINLTGATAKAYVSRRQGGTNLYTSDDSPATISVAITTPAAGLVTLVFPDTLTAVMFDDYYFEVWTDDASGNSVCVARGYLTIGFSNR